MPTTNIKQIEAERKQAIRRFILVRQFPSHGEDDPGGFLHEADGVCFADGGLMVFKEEAMFRRSGRLEFYRDEDHCTLMNPECDLRWLDNEPSVIVSLPNATATTSVNTIRVYLDGIELNPTVEV